MKTKGYLLFYYIGIVNIGVLLCINNKTVDYTSYSFRYLLIIINLIITIVNTIALLRKKKLEVKSALLPISFIIFSILVIIGCLLFNDRVIIHNIHFGYYLGLIVFGYTFVNIYTLLNIKFKDN